MTPPDARSQPRSRPSKRGPGADASRTEGHALPLARLLEAAADAVASVRAGRSLTDALAEVDARARPGAQALAFHAMRWLGAASAARAMLVPRKPPAWVDAVLLVSLALLRPSETPLYDAHTVVDQAVACVRRRAQASAGFVNAVLRRYLREREVLAASIDGPSGTDLVARYQHPAWWIERVRRDWPAHWTDLLTADQAAAPMVLRVNARVMDAPAYLVHLRAEGLDGLPFSSHGLVLAAPVPVTRLPGFDTGWVSVQDRSAQIAAPLLLGRQAWANDELPPLPAGARVLDACAAPGGKTAHLLELADLELTALDSDPQRLARVGETLERVGRAAPLPAVRLVAADAADTAAWWDGQLFDAILLDAPCSASGIVRRHPDVRWLRRDSDIAALARTQAGLLDRLWPLLKPGGRLVYATCSVFRAEGESQIEAFLQRTAGVRRLPAPGHLLPLAHNPSDAVSAASHPGPAEPAVQAVVADVVGPAGDGFYYASLVRAA